MISLLKSYYVIDGRTKLTPLFLLLLGGIVGSFIEAIGLTLIFPLISIIMSPDVIEQDGIAFKIYHFFEFKSKDNFLLFLTFAVTAVFIAKSVYMLGLYYIQSYLVNRWQCELSYRLFNMYVRAPFSMHLRRNSAELIRNLGLTSSFYNGFVFSLLSLLIEGIVGLSIIIVLIYYSPSVTMSIFLILIIITALQHKYMGRFFNRIGIDNSEISKQNTKCMYQSLGAVKETKILAREKYFINIFHELQKRLTKNNRKTQFVSRIPTVVYEVSLMLIMAGSILVVLTVSYGSTNMLAMLGLLAAAAMRLLPIVSKVLNALNALQHNRHIVELLEADIIKLSNSDNDDELIDEDVSAIPIVSLEGDIELKNISFSYPGSNKLSLKNITVTIPKAGFIGLVGMSGSGKTTLADIILGLHAIDSGEVLVNGKIISHDKKSICRINAGYVPQEIYITDDTIERNIAFGVPDEEIIESRIMDAIELAQLSDFVKSLPNGIKSNMGEGGSSVSAGQRQRIGIARALYHKPDLIVLDEATSSLDSNTERYITDTFESLKGEKTVVAIAHRLHTLKNSDLLFFLHEGGLVDVGTFDELLNSNQEFKKTVELGQI